MQFVDFVHSPLVGKDGIYLYIEIMIKKERKKNCVNLYVKARLYAHAHNSDFFLTYLQYKKLKYISQKNEERN